MEFHIEKCPKCGKEVSVPEDLMTVICSYCGHSFDADNGSDLTEEEDTTAQAAFEESYNEAVELLNARVTNIRDLKKKFNKQLYESSFYRYSDDLGESLDCFDKAYANYRDSKEELVTRYAEAFASKIKANMSELSRAEQEDYAYLYVAYAVPAILRYGKKYSSLMADALLATWNRDYPKRKLGKSTFENINSGFKHKFCFITTAVCETLGKTDDCYELTAFRSFRDNYLSSLPEGGGLITEYYMIAPLIVRAIDSTRSKDAVYSEIWTSYLSGCLSLYENNRYEECKDAYTKMVEDLREKWL